MGNNSEESCVRELPLLPIDLSVVIVAHQSKVSHSWAVES